MNIGIDKIGFYAPYMFVDMNKLAVARGVEPEKYTIGIGQEKMAVPPLTQDAVSLAANAALQILNDSDKAAIDCVMFGTESGVDHSKSAGINLHKLLGLHDKARTMEIKQACYGATAGLQMAKGHIALHPDRKVLVLGSDIARYGLKSGGEATQGAGAVAMVVSANPHILALEDTNTYMTSDIMDFWRPLYSDTAKVDGKLSNEAYLSFFKNVWDDYKNQSGYCLDDFTALCFHLPYTKLGKKALRAISEEGSEDTQKRLFDHLEVSQTYNKQVGNIYTGSLYLSLLSLLEQQNALEDGTRIGLFSYGSGAVGEFFSGCLQPGYQHYLDTTNHEKLLASRTELSVAEYEEVFARQLPQDGSDIALDTQADPASIVLTGIRDHVREYLHKTNP